MTIYIEDLNLNIIIGLLDFEKEAPQKIIINLKLVYAYKEKQFINYADIVMQIEDKLQQEKYELLEEALIGLKALLFFKYPNIKNLFIKISKPNILPNCIVSLSQEWKL